MDLNEQQYGGNLKNWALISGCAAALLICIFAYFPGLNGPFVFDDFAAINVLGNQGGVSDWQTFKTFVFSFTPGPTGRPLSMLSFLIDGNNWPTDPWPFKRTNLVIHLVNGVLLGALVSKTLMLLGFEKGDARWVALLSAACWLLHPFLVSTTLYVVQRMTQLSTLFVFAGLIGYLHGRSLLLKKTAKAYLMMTLSIVIFGLLAIISKENGILLPVLIGIFELTVLASRRQQYGALDRRWTMVFILAPSVTIVAYLGLSVFSSDFFKIMLPRDFSTYERLLTQPRILFDYLQNWFIPKLYTTGVFQDHYIKSTGIFSPITTAISAIFHIAIITMSVVYRRKWPLIALAILFFYAGHLLESTVLNLELYFEHRNYLPACFLFVPLIAFLQQKMRSRLFVLASISLMIVLGGFTRYSATVWQDLSSMVAVSAAKAPTSARAQVNYADDLFNAGQYEASLQVLDRAIEAIPFDKPQLQLSRLLMLCRLNILDAGEFERAAKIVSNSIYDPRLANIYQDFASNVAGPDCAGVSLDALQAMFVNMLQVPSNAERQSLRLAHVRYFIGFVELARAAPAAALEQFEESLQARPDPAMAMSMADQMAIKKYFKEALQLSNLAMREIEKNPPDPLSGVGPDAAVVRGFQAAVRADMNDLQGADTSHRVP